MKTGDYVWYDVGKGDRTIGVVRRFKTVRKFIVYTIQPIGAPQYFTIDRYKAEIRQLTQEDLFMLQMEA